VSVALILIQELMKQSNTKQPASFTTSIQTVLKFVDADEDKTEP
jgi:hypothetical protein